MVLSKALFMNTSRVTIGIFSSGARVSSQSWTLDPRLKQSPVDLKCYYFEYYNLSYKNWLTALDWNIYTCIFHIYVLT